MIDVRANKYFHQSHGGYGPLLRSFEHQEMSILRTFFAQGMPCRTNLAVFNIVQNALLLHTPPLPSF